MGQHDQESHKTWTRANKGVAECKLSFKGKLWGSTGVDILIAPRHSDLASGASGDIPMAASKDLDSGLVRGRHPYYSTCIGPLGKGTDLSQVHKSIKKGLSKVPIIVG
jgi:hypothetical protein